MNTLPATPNPEHLARRVAELIDAGRLGAARPLLAALRRLSPPSAELAELSALLALRDGRLDAACDELDAAVATAPEHARLRRCRADLRRRKGDLIGAAQDAAEAVVLDPTEPWGKAVLGALMLDLGHPADAVSCLTEAVAARPADPLFRESLAAAQTAMGDPRAAAETLAAGIAAVPGRAELRNLAVFLALQRRDFADAVRLAEDARQAGVADACLFGLKGHALSSLGRHEEAAEAYTEAVKLAPEDEYVRHLAAASGVLTAAPRAPATYLKAVFDGYAGRFDSHLISLRYRAPGLIRAALLRHLDLGSGRMIGPVLDLGCGTGLVAVVLSDLPIGPITGVDASPQMLAEAAAKRLYAGMSEADLMDLLSTDPTRWALILAADVLCYFGSLDEVLTAAHSRLQPAGLFVFTVEELPPERQGQAPGNGAWLLGRQARYAHSLGYVRSAAEAAGFAVRAIEREMLREEAGAPVAGLLAVLERTRHDA